MPRVKLPSAFCCWASQARVGCLGNAPLGVQCLQRPNASVQHTGAGLAFKGRKAVGGRPAALQFGGARDLVSLLLLQPLGAGQHLGDGFCEGFAIEGGGECYCRCSSWPREFQQGAAPFAAALSEGGCAGDAGELASCLHLRLEPCEARGGIC